MSDKVLRREPAQWLLNLHRHGERVTSQHESTDVCVCMCEREGQRRVCVLFRQGENGNVIEKVEEVKEIQRNEGKVSGLCSQLGNHTHETFSRKLAESCPYRRAD